MSDAPDFRLDGRRLFIARAVVIAIFVLGFVVYMQSIPSRSTQLLTIALQNQRALKETNLPIGSIANYVFALDNLIFAACFVIAGVIFALKPNDRMTIFSALLLVAYGFTIVRPPEALTLVDPFLHRLMDAVRAMGTIAILFFTYLFPDGRFVPRWTMIVGAVWTGWILSGVIFYDSFLNPDVWSATVRVPLFIVFYLTGICAQIYRYRGVSNLAQRQQTKWVVLGLATTLAGYALFFLAPILFPAIREESIARLMYIWLGVPVLYFSALAFPVTLATAILRYRLWDIDIVISRTLAYSALTIMLGLIYFASVAVLSQFFRALTGQQQSEIITVISTLGIAALFNPFRVRIQTGIDRRFNRHKYNALQVLASFGATVREETDLNRLTDELARVAEETMKPAHVSLWFRKQKD